MESPEPKLNVMKDATKKYSRKEVFGWITYDWANSAFYTIVITVLGGPYLQALARADVGEDGVVYSFGTLGSVTPESMIPFFLGISILMQVFFLPLLGAIADFTHLKKSLMLGFSYLGVIASGLLFFIVGDNYLIGCLLLSVSNMFFAAANVFYNAFLIDVAPEADRDSVSSRGYALGYLSGVVILVACLLFLQSSATFNLDKGLAVRICMLASSLWWGLFSIVTFATLRRREAPKAVPPGSNLLTIGFSGIGVTLRDLAKLPKTLRFLLAYLFYNDGIQTVILTSSIFINYELFVSRGIASAKTVIGELPAEEFLIVVFLIAQVGAVLGSLGFNQLSKLLGAKRTILVCLGIWCSIVAFAFNFLDTPGQAQLMGAMIGSVLGSTQALSRSLFSQLIPPGRESSFFGFYEISEKGTSWMGTMVFSIVVAAEGSYRKGILAVATFFVIGFVILLFTDTDAGIREAAGLKE